MFEDFLAFGRLGLFFVYGGVEWEDRCVERFVLFPIDVIIDGAGFGAFVSKGEGGALFKGHGKQAIQAAAIGWVLEMRLAGDLNGYAVDVDEVAVAKEEEVGKGDVDGFFVVEVENHVHVAIKIGFVAVEGHPNVANDAGAFEVGQGVCVAGFDALGIAVGTGAIPAAFALAEESFFGM